MNIKIENDDLEKQVNNLANKILLKTFLKTFFISLLFIVSNTVTAQDIKYNNGQKYIIGEISVTGNTNFSEQTVITYSGLRKGEEISIPGEEISTALKKLWNSKLFSAIDIYLAKTEGNVAFLEINLIDLPELNEVKIEGVKKSK